MSRTARHFPALILGGARSGKSTLAERIAAGYAGPRVYVATAAAGDEEMAARIADHQARRGADWRTLEVETDLASAFHTAADLRAGFVLVDCLTLWTSNLILSDQDPVAHWSSVETALDACAMPVVLVSNEVGLGIVPANALARRFRDVAGIVNQRAAAKCTTVLFTVAGLATVIKGDCTLAELGL